MVQPYQQVLDKNLEECKQLINESGWNNESVPSGYGNMTMSSRVYKDGLKIFRGSCTIPGSMELISDIVWNATEAEAKSVDKYVQKFKTVKTFKEYPNIRVDYAIMAFPWPIWNRDVMYVISRTKISSNQMVIWAGSVDDVKVPKQKKTVRLVDLIGAVFIEQVTPHSCKVTRVIFGNPSGSLPVMVTNNMGVYQVAGLLKWISDNAKKSTRNGTSKRNNPRSKL